MFRNYLKTAVRNLLRYKGFTLINIASLAIGITGCLVVGLFVWDELRYDKFIKGGENIYRIYTKSTSENGKHSAASVPPMFATYVRQQYPEVEHASRLLMWNGTMLMEAGEIRSYEEKGLIADSNFFKIFPLQFLRGNPLSALEGNSVVLTEDLAKKYFGTLEAIDRIIKLDKTDYAVKGVLAKLPEQFHLDFKYMIPLQSVGLPSRRMESWGWQQFFTYVKLKPGTNIEQFQSKFQDAIRREAHPKTQPDGFTYLPFFQPLKNIHLRSSEFTYDNAKRGNHTYVKGLSLIAIFVLIIACFNFVNLATARSFRRAKEIGVRKVVGADRKQLIVQFTAETILLAVVSIIIATIATAIILPSLNNFTDKNISFNPFTNPLMALAILVSGVVIGIMAGIYPALVLSGFQPIKVLKGMKSTGNNSSNTAWLRQVLVIVQFALSALLIVSTTIVYRQLNYMHGKDLGFNKEQVLYFSVRGDINNNPETFKAELKRNRNVLSVAGGYGLPGDQYAGDGIIVPGANGDKRLSANQFLVDHDYIKTLGLQLVSGRDFSRDMLTDVEEAFIINETAVKQLGFGTNEKAIGQRLHWDKWEPDSLNPIKKGRVIGVIKDFHYKSLHEKVTTTVLQIYPPILEKMAVKIKTDDVKNTIAHINTIWNKFSPDFPLDYKFMDDSYAAMYNSEDKLSSLLWIFTVMAIFVGCLGLFGLAAFSAEQRKKELGIRKVLGASVMTIVAMLSKSFLKPVLVASLVAFPIAWYLMNKWLEEFPYRVNISWWVFAISAVAALIIALLTVSFQSIKAALANPIKSLRTE